MGSNPLETTMAKIDKKRKKIEERIEFLENDMKLNLKQKVSNTAEISVSDYLTKIQDLRKQLNELK